MLKIQSSEIFSNSCATAGDPNWPTPKDWLEEDAEDPGDQLMTDNEIISVVIGERPIDDFFFNDDDEESDSQSSASDTKACEAFNVVLKWLKSVT